MSTGSPRNIAVASFVALALGLFSASVAVADNVFNTVDATVDADSEIMSLDAGGATGTTQLGIQFLNLDGFVGCNIVGGTSLTLGVISNNPAIATVAPETVTFTSCGERPPLTVTPLAEGSATIFLTVIANTTPGGSFNLNPATFTVDVSPAANTPPSVLVSGVTGGDTYHKGAVPNAMCEVTDAEDGASSFAATLGPVTGPFEGDGIGTQTASCSYIDAGGLTATSSATYNIVDDTPPAISYTLAPADPDGQNGWYSSDVSLAWIVSDGESPNSLVLTGCVDQTINLDQSSTVFECSATSAGGSAGPVSVAIQRDATDPTILGSVSAAPNASGWYNSGVTVSFVCSDETSGVASCSDPVSVSADGARQSVTGTAADNAGNTASATVDGINVDRTAPTVLGLVSAPPNASGWYNSGVTVSFVCSDETSGVASCSDPVSVSDDGAGQSVTGSAADNAGNTASATVDGINVDRTAPIVSLEGGPADGAVYKLGEVPPAPTCSARDALSGLVEPCDVSGYSTTVGTHTVTAKATDNAGNAASVSVTYTVSGDGGWTVRGFYKPVDMSGVTNIVKAGSTVPLKFEAFDGPTELTAIDIVQSFEVVFGDCETNSTVDDIENYSTGNTSLRYDGGQFIQNWKVPHGAGVCYEVTLTLQDGSTAVATFKTK